MTTRNIFCRACGAPLTAALYCNDCGTSTRDEPFGGLAPREPMRLRRRSRPRGFLVGAVASLALAMRRRRRRARMRVGA